VKREKYIAWKRVNASPECRLVNYSIVYSLGISLGLGPLVSRVNMLLKCHEISRIVYAGPSTQQTLRRLI
jgi:hypothetical protein